MANSDFTVYVGVCYCIWSDLNHSLPTSMMNCNFKIRHNKINIIIISQRYKISLLHLHPHQPSRPVQCVLPLPPFLRLCIWDPMMNLLASQVPAVSAFLTCELDIVQPDHGLGNQRLSIIEARFDRHIATRKKESFN